VQVVAVGVSHTSTPVDLRERLAVPSESLPDVLRSLREHVGEALILSTCNRVELYAVCGHEASGADLLRQFLASHGRLTLATVREAAYAYAHESAVRHLLRVASGLDSMVVGEDEILGQVRRALTAARCAGTVGPMLDRLGDMALACGKRIRTVTALGSDRESIASVAVRLAMRDHPARDRAHVLVLGAGEAARGVVAHLATLSPARLTLLNRTYDRAALLANETGGDVRSWDDLPTALGAADVVFACTSAPEPVLDAATLAERARASERPLLCVDLGVPRAIDPAATRLAGVRLIAIDHVEAEAARRRTAHTRDLTRAESIVHHEAERYMEWWRGRGVVTTIARLRTHAETIRDAEVERAMARLPELDPHAQRIVRDLAARMVNKLLHHPTLTLKRDPEGANMALVLERLFALDDSAAGRDLTHRESRAS
jgi:glutamyl-tRNA reductase